MIRFSNATHFGKIWLNRWGWAGNRRITGEDKLTWLQIFRTWCSEVLQSSEPFVLLKSPLGVTEASGLGRLVANSEIWIS